MATHYAYAMEMEPNQHSTPASPSDNEMLERGLVLRGTIMQMKTHIKDIRLQSTKLENSINLRCTRMENLIDHCLVILNSKHIRRTMHIQEEADEASEALLRDLDFGDTSWNTANKQTSSYLDQIDSQLL
jgi:hypothetical protein